MPTPFVFCSFLNLTSIAIRHGTIIPKARIQNMPPSSPTSMVLLNSNFPISRMIKSPNKMKTKAFDLLMKISSFANLKIRRSD